MVALDPLHLLLRDPLYPGVWEEIKQAGLLITLISVLRVPAEQVVLSSEVPPILHADLPAIVLKLDGSPPLAGDLRGVHPLMLVDPLIGLLEGPDGPFLGRHKVQLLEQLRQAPSEPFEEIFLATAGSMISVTVIPRGPASPRSGRGLGGRTWQP